MWPVLLADVDWSSLAERLGFPVVGLVAVCVSVAYVTRGVWREICVPVRDKLIARVMNFFDRLETILDRMERRGTLDTATLERHEEILWRIEGAIDEVQDQCEAIKARQEGQPPPPHRRTAGRPPRPPRPPAPPHSPPPTESSDPLPR